MRSKEIFRGCLIGGAAGDALGYAVEFMEDADVFRKYGENGITEYDLYKGTACRPSRDRTHNHESLVHLKRQEQDRAYP